MMVFVMISMTLAEKSHKNEKKVGDINYLVAIIRRRRASRIFCLSMKNEKSSAVLCCLGVVLGTLAKLIYMK